MNNMMAADTAVKRIMLICSFICKVYQKKCGILNIRIFVYLVKACLLINSLFVNFLKILIATHAGKG
jgi:hypothetical protein